MRKYNIKRDPEFLYVVLSTLYYQKEKISRPTEITKDVFAPTNYVDITKTAEYTLTLRAIKILVNANILRKVTPDAAKKSKAKFMAHYVVNEQELSKFVIDFISNSSSYAGHAEGIAKDINAANPFIARFLIMYFRGLAVRMRTSSLRGFYQSADLDPLTFKEAILMLVDKIAIGSTPADDKLLKLIQKAGSKDRKQFLRFIRALRLFAQDYRPYSSALSLTPDFSAFIRAVGEGEKAKHTDWEEDGFQIAHGKKDATSYFPHD